MKGKQLNKGSRCCRLDLYSFRCSIHFSLLFICFNLFGFIAICFHSFGQSVRFRYICSIQSNSISFVVIKVILTTVYLLYTVHLLHDLIFYCVLIALPVEVVIDMLINKTTPLAILQEQSFQCDLC